MKKNKTLVLLFFMMILGACSSNDEDVLASIEGTWKLTSYTLENSYDINQDGMSSNDIISETDGCFLEDTWVFNSDHTGRTTQSSILTLALTTPGNFSVTCNRNTNAMAFTWSLNSITNEVIIDFGPSGYRCVLSGNKLTYTRPEIGIVPFVTGNQNASDIETVVFTKQ
jgi:hypothetical protein